VGDARVRREDERAPCASGEEELGVDAAAYVLAKPPARSSQERRIAQQVVVISEKP